MIGHIHLSDCDGKVHGDLPAGMGVTPIKEYLQAIVDTGYDGTVSIELEYSPDPDKIVEWAQQAYDGTAAIMRELGVRALGSRRWQRSTSTPARGSGRRPTTAIGAIGAGFIMRDIHLVAYNEAGFNTVAIASRTPEHARAAAEQNAVGTVYDTWQELLDDPRVEIVDIAYPPDQQLEIVREACRRPHVKGILAQKPIAFTLEEAMEIVRVCRESGKTLGVNQNMRYDQSMRALKTLLDGGHMGEPVVAQIVMNARPHWQEFVTRVRPHRDPQHVDPPPRRLPLPVRRPGARSWCRSGPIRATTSRTTDGMAFYILEYADGLRCIGSDDCFTWADGRIEWRVEGTEGIAKGRIGWPDYPAGSPSTIDYHLALGGGRVAPAPLGGALVPAGVHRDDGPADEGDRDRVGAGDPGPDNLRTMALVEAAYRSAAQGRTVELAEVLTELEVA